MGRPTRTVPPPRPHGAHYRDDGSVWHTGTVARGSMAGESFRSVTTTASILPTGSIARPSSQYGHRENYPSTSSWRYPTRQPPRVLKEEEKITRRSREFVEIYGRRGSSSSSAGSTHSEQAPTDEPWRPKSPDLRRRHPDTGAMVGPHHWGGHRAFREDGTVWHTGSAARPHSQYGTREWYPAHQHAGFVEAVVSTSELGKLREQRMQPEANASDEEPLPALDRPMSPAMRAWGAQATASVAQAQASAARAQTVAAEASRATWRVTTAGDLSQSPVIRPLPKWQGLQSACGPYPTQLRSRLDSEPELVAVSMSEPKLHRGPLVDCARPRRVASPDLLTHKDRTPAGTETIVCYFSAQDLSSADAHSEPRAQLQAFCAAQINDHGTPTTNLIKFSLAELIDPARVTATRLKTLGPALSGYSGRLVIVVPSGSAPQAPYDLGSSAGRCSSNALAQYVCAFLMHLRTHHPAMLRTSQVDLVVGALPLPTHSGSSLYLRYICNNVCALIALLFPDGAGSEMEDPVTERVAAQCLLDALRAYEDPLSLEDKVFSRPLSVTAPKVPIHLPAHVLLGHSVTVVYMAPTDTIKCALAAVVAAVHLQGQVVVRSPGSDFDTSGLAVMVPSMGKQEVFRCGTEDVHGAGPSSGLKGYLVGHWSVADLSPVAMAVATVTTEDPIGHRC